jgi:hypothetical protein
MAREKKPKDALAPRVTKVTKPATKAKTTKVKVLEKTFKSAERITESDDEDMQNAPAIPAREAGPETDFSGRKPVSELFAGKNNKEGTFKSGKTINGSKPRSTIEQLAQGDDSDSSDEEEDSEFGSSSDPTLPVKAKVNGTTAIEDDELESEDEDEDEGEEVSKQADKRPTALAPVAPRVSSRSVFAPFCHFQLPY